MSMLYHCFYIHLFLHLFFYFYFLCIIFYFFNCYLLMCNLILKKWLSKQTDKESCLLPDMVPINLFELN